MSTNHTSNYNLCQWEPSDKVLRTEFNADNAKIDAAIAAVDSRISSVSGDKASVSELNGVRSSVDSLTQTVADHTAELAKKGNCQLAFYSYTGNGRYGESNANSITFSNTPAVVCVGRGGSWLVLVAGVSTSWVVGGASGRGIVNITWSGKTVRWYSDTADAQMNASSTAYTAIALCKLS